ncbi:MAG TPA: tetratricopeptide repeat protein, partial [Pyrinomonadaceae bacterium]|nr:tetratricopeptide repeat protein [Pyrinomonadaceae bacterium]
SNSAVVVPPGHPDINGNTAGGGMQPEVQEAIEKAKSSPGDFDAQLKVAQMYYQVGRFDQAIEYLKRANQIKPDDYETIVNLGNAYYDSDKFEDAEKLYTQALAKKPNDVSVRTDMGLTFLFRLDYDRAIKEFTRSLELDPSHVQTLQNITVAYTKKGDAAKAKATLAKLEQVDAQNPALPKLREDLQKLEGK